MDHRPSDARIRAVLGPTNTGKTRLAVERMLGHASGIIGCPLRLLAQEIYDRIVEQRGRATAALITGEERIVPKSAKYFAATVEAMPVDLPVEFLAVDEVQLAADPERGHVFTDRLLHARGRQETMFLGSETARLLLRRLVPGIEIETRPRLSTLRHAGHSKLTRLPRRSATIAFSIQDVYSIAELVRRRRGGAAVVLGALSPKTRNAQVAMYEEGEVDHLVATDAIGMGLNMDIAHVAFAARRKFDGHISRDLVPAELGQISGRAGRYVQDGTFGTTGDCPPFEDRIVEALEEHRFASLQRVTWRSRDLDFSSHQKLATSLEVPPSDPWLVRVRKAEDERTLRALVQQEEVARRADSSDRVRLLWDVASIPDFRTNRDDTHIALLAKIFLALSGKKERLPATWTLGLVEHLNRFDGDLDALMTRLEHVRVWSYVSHREIWVEDPDALKERTREVEDKLSDALHCALAQRFVDKRMATLSRRMKDSSELLSAVRHDGEVRVEGEYVGTLQGFCFHSDQATGADDARAVRSAARRALAGEMSARARALAAAGDGSFSLNDKGQILWECEIVAHLAAGDSPWRPRAVLDEEGLLVGNDRKAVEDRLQTWLRRHVGITLDPLFAPARAELEGPARGIAWRLQEEAGVLARTKEETNFGNGARDVEQQLRGLGIRIGRTCIHVPAMLENERRRLSWLLVSVHANVKITPVPKGIWHEAGDRLARQWATAGFLVIGRVAARVAALEEVVFAIKRRSWMGAFAFDATEATGLPVELADSLIAGLGHRKLSEQEGQTLWTRNEPRRQRPNTRPSVDKNSPFAALARRAFKTRRGAKQKPVRR